MRRRSIYRCSLLALMTWLGQFTADASLDGYWPLDETQGTVAPNAVAGGTPADLFNGATWVTDAEQGTVLEFDGFDGYASAGTIPALTLDSDFTWSFWSLNNQSPTTNVVLGNRYSPASGVDFAPREFTKFTNQSFEWHHDAVGENVDYPDMPEGQWIHNAVVKDGNTLISYRNGLVNGTRSITGDFNNPQPFYFGGDQTLENWAGRLNDIAIWSDALPASSVIGLARKSYTPLTAPVTNSTATPRFTDTFGGPIEASWNATGRGLENNAITDYTPPSTQNGQLTLSGTAIQQYWYGNSIESQKRFSAAQETIITVDRLSLTGTGSAFRSSLWILGDDAHYLHFSQNIGETGWSWNARDDGGVGTVLPTGSGVDIVGLNPLDNDPGQHQMQLRLVPTGTPGEVNIFLSLDGKVVAGRGFSAFPSDFQVILTGQARASNDTVNAVFDNFVVEVAVPEPSAMALIAGAFSVLALRRGARSGIA